MLVDQLQRLNPGIVDNLRAEDIAKRLARVRPNIEGNLDAWEYLKGLKTVFVAAEKRERNIRLLDPVASRPTRFHVTDEFTFTNGTPPDIRTDIMFFINGVPIIVVETKAATQWTGWRGPGRHSLLPQARAGTAGRDADPRPDPPGPVLTTGRPGTCPARGSSTGGTNWPRGATSRRWSRRSSPRACAAGDHRVHPLHPQGRGAFQGRPAAPPDAGRRAVRPAGQGRSKRRGLIWHTQGSGKTYTMITVAKRLIEDPVFENPTVLMLVDRNELETQLFGNLEAVGFGKVAVAESKKDLQKLLKADRRGLIVSMIHKFDGYASRRSTSEATSSCWSTRPIAPRAATWATT